MASLPSFQGWVLFQFWYQHHTVKNRFILNEWICFLCIWKRSWKEEPLVWSWTLPFEYLNVWQSTVRLSHSRLLTSNERLLCNQGSMNSVLASLTPHHLQSAPHVGCLLRSKRWENINIYICFYFVKFLPLCHWLVDTQPYCLYPPPPPGETLSALLPWFALSCMLQAAWRQCSVFCTERLYSETVTNCKVQLKCSFFCFCWGKWLHIGSLCLPCIFFLQLSYVFN